jgi:hypothetical protein
MNKFALVSLTLIFCISLAASAFAGTIKPGGKTSCKDASSITLEAVGTSTADDRSNANAVIWKSSNFTTIPITLGPGADQGFKGARGVGIMNKHTMGRSKVVLTGQNNFSRGDSIGDISGEVRITNTGTIDINVSCG